MESYPYVITVSSEKGGVGKTTLAVNLAIYLKALQEDLPVSIFSLDNHFTVDKMFSINGQGTRGDVADLLLETPGIDLLQTGQYGVSFIPSSASLGDLRDSIKSPMLLGRLLALSRIPGILIIDTKPELDILTQNALYAADRVIIPVKDMPSLENCRNIFALFEKRDLDKKSLTLIPCLIDGRIKYDGPFKDQKTLLKAYAINRGYRCMDSFISKSPKVESLNTNPDGKIYPILTHARGTEVYNQFTQLARQLMKEYRQAGEPRALLFDQWLRSEEERKTGGFNDRLSMLKQDCPLCGRTLSDGSAGEVSFYYEASDGGACGFLDEECFIRFLMSAVYNLERKPGTDEQLRQLMGETAAESVFGFRGVMNGQGPAVEFYRFHTRRGLQTKKTCPLKEFEGSFLSKEKSPLFSFISSTLGDGAGRFREAILTVHPANPKAPRNILLEENYKPLRRFMRQVHEQISGQQG